jgi:hypothetical protein
LATPRQSHSTPNPFRGRVQDARAHYAVLNDQPDQPTTRSRQTRSHRPDSTSGQPTWTTTPPIHPTAVESWRSGPEAVPPDRGHHHRTINDTMLATATRPARRRSLGAQQCARPPHPPHHHSHPPRPRRLPEAVTVLGDASRPDDRIASG